MDLESLIYRAEHAINQLEFISSDSGRIHDCNSLIGLLDNYRINCEEGQDCSQSLERVVNRAEQYLIDVAKRL